MSLNEDTQGRTKLLIVVALGGGLCRCIEVIQTARDDFVPGLQLVWIVWILLGVNAQHGLHLGGIPEIHRVIQRLDHCQLSLNFFSFRRDRVRTGEVPNIAAIPRVL